MRNYLTQHIFYVCHKQFCMLYLYQQYVKQKIFNKQIKSANYNIDTYKKKIYIYGIANSEDERKEVINEAKQILDIEDVIASILLVKDLRIQKN